MSLNKPIRGWNGRRVWVVGASSGIGAALARALIVRGARVALSARNAQALAELEQDEYVGSALWSEDRQFVIKKFGLDEAAFEDIMSQPAKSHYEYPTNRIIYEKLPWLFAVLKRFATRG
jgi:nucleoside-diphosphate-sugar epimerase